MIGLVLAIVILHLLYDISKSKSKGAKPNRKKGVVVMDTSALIDGRIVDIIRSGFLLGTIIVPKSVLRELQMLADGRDTYKRARARNGLDVVNELKRVEDVEVIVVDDLDGAAKIATDDNILRLAGLRNAMLCTTDFNLNKVARAEGVKVLNVNELAQALRSKFLPGENIQVKIQHKGEAKGQGVGYLEDGTMAVVENASHSINNTVIARVDKSLQTEAGKLVFATHKK